MDRFILIYNVKITRKPFQVVFRRNLVLYDKKQNVFRRSDEIMRFGYDSFRFFDLNQKKINRIIQMMNRHNRNGYYDRKREYQQFMIQVPFQKQKINQMIIGLNDLQVNQTYLFWNRIFRQQNAGNINYQYNTDFLLKYDSYFMQVYYRSTNPIELKFQQLSQAKNIMIYAKNQHQSQQYLVLNQKFYGGNININLFFSNSSKENAQHCYSNYQNYISNQKMQYLPSYQNIECIFQKINNVDDVRKLIEGGNKNYCYYMSEDFDKKQLMDLYKVMVDKKIEKQVKLIATLLPGIEIKSSTKIDDIKDSSKLDFIKLNGQTYRGRSYSNQSIIYFDFFSKNTQNNYGNYLKSSYKLVWKNIKGFILRFNQITDFQQKKEMKFHDIQKKIQQDFVGMIQNREKNRINLDRVIQLQKRLVEFILKQYYLKIDYFQQMVLDLRSVLGNGLDQFDTHTLFSLKQSQVIYDSVQLEQKNIYSESFIQGQQLYSGFFDNNDQKAQYLDHNQLIFGSRFGGKVVCNRSGKSRCLKDILYNLFLSIQFVNYSNIQKYRLEKHFDQVQRIRKVLGHALYEIMIDQTVENKLLVLYPIHLSIENIRDRNIYKIGHDLVVMVSLDDNFVKLYLPVEYKWYNYLDKKLLKTYVYQSY